MLTGFKAVIQGASHKEQGKPCQDAAGFCLSSRHALGCVSVADGHGGEKYTRSGTGADFAVKTAREVIKNYVSRRFPGRERGENQQFDPKKFDEDIAKMEKNIIYRWRNRVLGHEKINPLSEEERLGLGAEADAAPGEDDVVSLYGTTLAAAVIMEGFWFALQIGDGACAVIPAEGKAYIPEELEDGSLGFGKTTSLCNKDAINHFRHCFGQETIRGITVATDGVSDSYLPEKYLEFTESLRTEFTLDRQKAKKELLGFLPVLSERGSRDDCAIAGLFEVEGK